MRRREKRSLLKEHEKNLLPDYDRKGDKGHVGEMDVSEATKKERNKEEADGNSKRKLINCINPALGR